jgi:hypothetical protein
MLAQLDFSFYRFYWVATLFMQFILYLEIKILNQYYFIFNGVWKHKSVQ